MTQQTLVSETALSFDRGAPVLGGMVKRAVDFVGALALIILLLPLFLVVAAIVALTDKGPLFFSHRRIGHDGQMFNCHKFRSMVVNSQEVLQHILATDPEARAEWEATQKLTNDPRISGIGHFLRATSLDELPQLFNVLVGEMSLVGPRPIVEAEAHHYAGRFATYLRARPGMTGLWQVSGRSDTSYRRRVALDTNYVRNWTLWSDIVILFKTVGVVFLRKGGR